MKTKYTATFADGTTITRKSERAYAVAWRATWTREDGGSHEVTGFAVSREKAVPYKPARAWVGRHMSARDRAEATRKNAEYIQKSGYRVEFAEAVAA